MKLEWRQLSATRMTSTCSRYTVDREPHYDDYPAVGFRYSAKRADLQANPLGEFETFELAAEACERNVTEQPQPKGQ